MKWSLKNEGNGYATSKSLSLGLRLKALLFFLEQIVVLYTKKIYIYIYVHKAFQIFHLHAPFILYLTWNCYRIAIRPITVSNER